MRGQQKIETKFVIGSPQSGGQVSYQRIAAVQGFRMLRATGHFLKFTSVEISRDNSSVDTVIMLWAGRSKTRVSIPCMGKRFISVPNRPHQVWLPSNFLCNE